MCVCTTVNCCVPCRACNILFACAFVNAESVCVSCVYFFECSVDARVNEMNDFVWRMPIDSLVKLQQSGISISIEPHTNESSFFIWCRWFSIAVDLPSFAFFFCYKFCFLKRFLLLLCLVSAIFGYKISSTTFSVLSFVLQSHLTSSRKCFCYLNYSKTVSLSLVNDEK